MQPSLEPTGSIKEVTIIYYGELSLQLQHSVEVWRAYRVYALP